MNFSKAELKDVDEVMTNCTVCAIGISMAKWQALDPDLALSTCSIIHR